jgi:hypothetical protein
MYARFAEENSRECGGHCWRRLWPTQQNTLLPQHDTAAHVTVLMVTCLSRVVQDCHCSAAELPHYGSHDSDIWLALHYTRLYSCPASLYSCSHHTLFLPSPCCCRVLMALRCWCMARLLLLLLGVG